jgi:hypothetical protein
MESDGVYLRGNLGSRKLPISYDLVSVRKPLTGYQLGKLSDNVRTESQEIISRQFRHGFLEAFKGDVTISLRPRFFMSPEP